MAFKHLKEVRVRHPFLRQIAVDGQAEMLDKSDSDPNYIFAPFPARIFKIASNYKAVVGYLMNVNGEDVLVMVLRHNSIIGQVAWAIYGSQYEENYIKLMLKRFIILNMENKMPETIYMDDSV